jgi:hypothetical protein
LTVDPKLLTVNVIIIELVIGAEDIDDQADASYKVKQWKYDRLLALFLSHLLLL